MTPTPPKFAAAAKTTRLIASLGKEFAIVRNPGYVYPPFEAYPMAPPNPRLNRGLVGIVKDMDGTTTTTEALCLHSLEMMVRRISGKLTAADWTGLDRVKDLPHVIGNSTTRHVEYLIDTYRAWIVPEKMKRAYVEAAAWTLALGQDPGRRTEVQSDMANLGIGKMADDKDFRFLLGQKSFAGSAVAKRIDALTKRFGASFRLDDRSNVVRAAIDIYYYRYHEILAAVKLGQGADLSSSILNQPGRRLIEPMPGVAVFLCLIKGWLTEAEAESLSGELAKCLVAHGVSQKKIDKARGTMAALSRYFAKHPLKVAVVTSSIEYEARIVLAEVFRVVQEQIAAWPIDKRRRTALAKQIATPEVYYDAMITASDSSEIRLKPHRDLYSIALHRIGLGPADFDRVMGFEDSESGTIAIRAAGVGCCIAVPFAETSGHNLDAATHIAKGGLPEVVLLESLYLGKKALKA